MNDGLAELTWLLFSVIALTGLVLFIQFLTDRHNEKIKQKATKEDPTEDIFSETQPGQYRIGRKGAKN